MSPFVDGAGVELAYEERGAGPAVLLIHDAASGATALERLARELEPHARAIAYDRRGYGASGSPEPYEATTVHEQAEDAAALLRALGVERAVACGIGFGALVALDLVVRHGGVVGAAVLADPPLYALVPSGAEALAAQRVELEQALRSGRLSAAERAHRALFADFAGLPTLPITRAGLRAVDAPVAVLTGDATPAAVVAAADALAALLPAARRAHGESVAAAARSVLDPGP